jgi:hypothetical protein
MTINQGYVTNKFAKFGRFVHVVVQLMEVESIHKGSYALITRGSW